MDTTKEKIPLPTKAELQEWVLSFLKEIETANDATILFAAETGSRGYGTNMDDSDLDIKGFFVQSTPAYMSVVGPIKAVRFFHKVVEIKGKEYEIDMELLDIKQFLKKKVIGNKFDHTNFWIYSKEVYINNFPPEILSELKDNLKLPIEKFYAVSKGFYTAFTKGLKHTKMVLDKDMLNSIVISLQFLHCAAFREFPLYNFFEEQKEFLERIKDSHMPEWHDKAKVIFEQAEIYFAKKKLQRHSETPKPDQILVSFLEDVVALNPCENDEIIKQMIKKQEVTKERAEEIFKQLLLIHKKI